jgi:uncharacterized delta-60 repeat protein
MCSLNVPVLRTRLAVVALRLILASTMTILMVWATPVQAASPEQTNASSNAPDPADLPPVAVDDSGPGFITFNDRSFITGDVLANDYDPDGDPLFVDGYNLIGTKGLVQYLYPGSLDTSFGSSGKVTTTFSSAGQGYALLQQADGRIIMAGSGYQEGFGMSFALARYTKDGSLDESFGDHGKVTTGFPNGSAANGLALQSDGKIVAAGAGNNEFALARYNPEGSLDQSFGSGGQVLTDFTVDTMEVANSVAIQADGKIVAAGFLFDADKGKFALARYNSNGTLDTTFGTKGRVTTNFTATSYDEGSSVAIQPDGKILVAGDIDANLAVARYTKNGTLDTSFGAGGKTTIFTSYSTVMPQIALLPDGKVLAAAESISSLYIARYNSNGIPDTTFGVGGLVTTYIGNCVGGSKPGLLAQDDGKIIMAGSCTPMITKAGYSPDGTTGASIPFMVIRYNSDGSLDASFGVDGMVTTAFSGICMPHGVVRQADGKIIVGGESADGFSMARYLKGGSFYYNPNSQFDTLGLGEQDYDVFSYVASDGVLTDTATVTITVIGGTEIYLPLTIK